MFKVCVLIAWHYEFVSVSIVIECKRESKKKKCLSPNIHQIAIWIDIAIQATRANKLSVLWKWKLSCLQEKCSSNSISFDKEEEQIKNVRKLHDKEQKSGVEQVSRAMSIDFCVPFNISCKHFFFFLYEIANALQYTLADISGYEIIRLIEFNIFNFGKMEWNVFGCVHEIQPFSLRNIHTKCKRCAEVNSFLSF